MQVQATQLQAIHRRVIGLDVHQSQITACALIDFILEELPDGNIILKRASVIPVNERWLHEPAMQQRLARANKWLQEHPFKETDLDHLEVLLSTTA